MKTRDITITLLTALGFLALSPIVQAVNPAPDGGYPGGNTAEGQNALLSLTTGTANTAVGLSSLQSNTTHGLNTAVGAAALLVNDSDQNTATGAAALLRNTTGAFNTAGGAFALFSNTTGDNNTAIGLQALFNNAAGGGNTAVGYSAGFNLTGDNNIDIGYFVEGVAGESNTIRIGTNLPAVDGVSACYIGGIWTQGCDPDTCYYVGVDADGKMGTHPFAARFMRDVLPMGKDSDSILALKPVSFHYKSDAKNTPCFGLIAEDVAKVNPALVVRDKGGDVFTVRYDQVNAMLLNEFLKEHEKVEQLEGTVASLVATVREEGAELRKVSSQIQANEARPVLVRNH